MIDIGRNNGAAARHFIAHKFGRYFANGRCAEVFTAMLARQHVDHFLALIAACGQRVQIGMAVLVFANGDIFHFRRDQTSARIMHLADILSGFSAAGATRQIEA